MSIVCRTEHDSMGKVDVPVDTLYGAQTQRAINNFKISRVRMPTEFLQVLCLIKSTAAQATADLGLLDTATASVAG